jgi:hypothetical protein
MVDGIFSLCSNRLEALAFDAVAAAASVWDTVKSSSFRRCGKAESSCFVSKPSLSMSICMNKVSRFVTSFISTPLILKPYVAVCNA